MYPVKKFNEYYLTVLNIKVYKKCFCFIED